MVFPGVFAALAKAACGDFKQGSTVISTAVDTIRELLMVVLGDAAVRGHGLVLDAAPTAAGHLLAIARGGGTRARSPEGPTSASATTGQGS